MLKVEGEGAKTEQLVNRRGKGESWQIEVPLNFETSDLGMVVVCCVSKLHKQSYAKVDCHYKLV